MFAKETGKPIIVVLASHKEVDDLDIVEMLTLARQNFSREVCLFLMICWQFVR